MFTADLITEPSVTTNDPENNWYTQNIMVLKWFFERICGYFTYWRTILAFKAPLLGYLKNSLSKWFFKEPWSERFLVEPEMVP